MNYRMLGYLLGMILGTEAALLLASSESDGNIRTQLEEALAYTRYLLGQEVLGEPIVCKALGGMEEQQLREPWSQREREQLPWRRRRSDPAAG